MTLPQMPSFSLNGRRALVAGGSRGIGLGCAVALGQAGAEVTVIARGAAQADQAVAQMQQAGMNANAQIMDVTDINAIKAFFAGQDPFDVLVNSAGLARHSKTTETTPEDFDAVMDINLRAAYFLAQQAAIQMKKLGGGSIIQISSQMGHVGGVDRAVYCSSKHAIEGMNKAMAIEFGADNIRVNSVCPTFIRTELTEATFADPAKRAWIDDKIRLPRVGEVKDIMGAVLFLASDAAAMVTGTSILVDGGWTAG